MLTACAGTEKDAEGSAPAEHAKTLVIGYESYPPSCYLDEDGKPAGIDMDIATEALSRMGYRPVFKSISWIDKDKLLASGDIDCVWGCFSMNGREDDYTWAGPYMKSDEVVAVAEGSSINAFADLAGKTVAVQATTEPETVFLDGDDLDLSAVANVYSLKDASMLYPSLSRGYVDAIAAHRLAIERYMSDNGVSYRILSEPLLESDLGVAFLKGTSSPVPAKLTRVLKQMVRDGSVQKILARYVDNPKLYMLGVGDGDR